MLGNFWKCASTWLSALLFVTLSQLFIRHLLIDYTCSVTFPSPSRTGSWRWPDSEEPGGVSHPRVVPCDIWTNLQLISLCFNFPRGVWNEAICECSTLLLYVSISAAKFILHDRWPSAPPCTLILSLRALCFRTDRVQLSLSWWPFAASVMHLHPEKTAPIPFCHMGL